MRRKTLVYCEVCGGAKPAGAPEFVVFHCLAFCSTDCLDDYRAVDDQRRSRKEAAGGSRPSAVKRPRAA